MPGTVALTVHTLRFPGGWFSFYKWGIAIKFAGNNFVYWLDS